MMNLAVVEKDMYEEFEPKKDSLFFKVGEQGLISFHGSNYNIKKRVSTLEKKNLLSDDAFLRITGNCYVNVEKVTTIINDCLYFGETTNGSKSLPVSKRQQEIIKQLIS
jgi:DNA-binding LytR/AlgR family response regulator